MVIYFIEIQTVIKFWYIFSKINNYSYYLSHIILKYRPSIYCVPNALYKFINS